jgi:hypothetical protein
LINNHYLNIIKNFLLFILYKMTVAKKFLKGQFLKGINVEHILGIIAFIFIAIVLLNYSKGKDLLSLPMTNRLSYSELNNQPSESPPTTVSPTYAPYNGVSNTTVATSADSPTAMNTLANNKAIPNPSDLLPLNNNNLWANSIPQADADLKNINLLNPSQLVGINTQGSSLRNSNLQLRSEPANPRMNTNCPWNISTIETDQFRKPLEIGS